MKTLIYDWELHQGAAVDELIPVTGLPTTGVGVRCHIRDTLDALAPRLILSHDGPTNRRVTVSAEGIRIQIGATVSGGLVMVQPRNRWVYDVEVYSLTDADDVLKPRAGTVYAYREATRESDTTALPPLASGDGRYLRIDGDQGLTPEQQAWAQHNSGTSPGGPGGASDHGALTGLADDDHPHYLTNARGDARYDAIGAAAAAVGAHAGATDPHGDRAFATAAVGTHAAAAGAHPMSGVDGLAAALALFAPLLSPALTGTPTAPTAAPGTASTQIASTAFVAAAIAALLNSAPGALDTLDELAAALGDDPNFATTVTNALAGKLAKASNLADLVDAAAARTNLGATTIGAQVFTAADGATIRALLALGAAALLGVGTTAGTVAAGDDSRIVGAVQTSRNVSTQHSLIGGGDLGADRTLSLVGDTASPGASKVYGTDASGVRGWYDAASGGGSPDGSGSELQYRGGPTTFAAASGTHWDAVNGRLSIGAGTSPAGMLHAQSSAASVCAGVLQGAASQTANIFDARNSAGSVLAGVTASGVLRCAGVSCQSTSSDALITYSSGFLLARFGYGVHVGAEGAYGGILSLRSDGAIGFASSTSLPSTPDTRLTRVGAGILGVRANSSSAGAAVSLVEMTAPGTPAAGGAFIYAEDSGGKTRLVAKYDDGSTAQISIQP